MSDPLSKEATASDIARAVTTGKATAIDVVEATLRRIEATEPTVNAFTDRLAERARRRAAEIDSLVSCGEAQTHFSQKRPLQDSCV